MKRAAVMIILLGLSPGFRAQDLKRPEEQLAAIYSLKVQLEIEQRRLDESLQRHSEQARAREDARGRLHRLYDDLDAMVEGRAEGDAALILAREQDIQKTEQEIEVLSGETRRIREAIRDAHARIELLGDRIGRLRKTLPSDTESLTGSWDVHYLPSGDKGVFMLRQSGTLLAGEYTLEGGWKGSLQGTFVDGKVLLHRIDSKLGRSSDLEGMLAPDGRTLRGNWQSFILSGGQPTNGSWIARKRQERAEP
ncbi:MAG: hypothetical protein HYS34_04710 [Acidobacteria bacterium]|nr:hypothetical protein [Acidobacteriota bacterium]